MTPFQTALSSTFSPDVLLVIVAAGIYGLFVGAVPGLTATMAVALLVPLTFFLDPVAGLAAIVTMEACCIFAGDIPTTLMRIPGTPSSAAYVDDAYALTRQHRHQQALGVSLAFSVVGGLIGAVILIFLAPMLARIAFHFSSYENFWLCVLGLSCAAVVSRGSPMRGLLALSIGLLLSCVGLGSTHGVPRLTFGYDALTAGINFIPAMIGLFGVSEVLRNVLTPSPVSVAEESSDGANDSWLTRGVVEVFSGIGSRLAKSVRRILTSSGIGALIGMLPGAGADIAAWVAYAVSKRTASPEDRDQYGNGSLQGIADATTANNASLAGAWIPALVLGIPGDSVTAIVIGVLYMKNVKPGPAIFEDPKQLSLVYAIYITFVLANLLLIPLGFLAIRTGALIVRIPRHVILPLILLFCIVGAFAIDASLFDVGVMLAMGVSGFVLDRCGVPLGPVVLGMILGSRLEETYVQSLTKDSSLLAFFERPIAAGLGFVCVALWLVPIATWLRRTLRNRRTPSGGAVAILLAGGITLAGSLTPQVASADEPVVPSFRREVMAVLSRTGCNMGTCHGNANGKGGLKLSLRGQSPADDYATLTRSLNGRRSNVLNPSDSLLLQKPLMELPHVGGRRFDRNSLEHRILSDWIAAGMPDDPDGLPQVERLEVSPPAATLYAPDVSVGLTVMAHFRDGSQRDVTTLAVYESSAIFVETHGDGRITSLEPGQTTVTVRYLDRQVPVRLEFVPDRPGFTPGTQSPANIIDEAVFRQLDRLRIQPSEICDDVTFLRRAYLDLTGLLPTDVEARAFLQSTSEEKRAELIDRLLASEEFNDLQALRWSDLLRVEQKTLDATGVKVFHDWIRQSFAKRQPLNEFAAEILSARGSTYQVGPTNFYRALRTPQERSEAAAQVFLGVRLQCAKCHNHPFDRWTQDDYYGWSNFFARVDYRIIENKRRDKNDKHEFDGEQIVEMKDDGDVTNPATGQPAGLKYLGAAPAESDETSAGSDGTKPDRLQQVAAWMAAPSNRRFAESQANRIWFQLMGRGVVDPIDDFRATNPPVNQELLNVLTDEFITGGYDVRHLMRLVMNSKTYQLASEPNATNQNDVSQFSRNVLRRLTAEQLLDAVSRVLDAPVKFGGYDAGVRAVQLAGVRDGGHRFAEPEIGDRFLALFGKPGRLLSCECERTDETTLAQTFELISGELIHDLLQHRDNRIAKRIKRGDSNAAIIDELYRAALSRPPSPEELAAAERHVTSHGRSEADRIAAMQDVTWALLNSNEFLIRR